MRLPEILDNLEIALKRSLRRERKYAEENADSYDLVHEWLQQFAVGTGYELAAGNFPCLMADGSGFVRSISLGIEAGNFNGIRRDGTDLSIIPSNTLDFIITNYFETFEYPIRVLLEWNRVLKTGSTLAMILMDTEHKDYDKRCGPLTSPRRMNCYTSLTIQRYLERAEFRQVTTEKYDHTLRVKAVK